MCRGLFLGLLDFDTILSKMPLNLLPLLASSLLAHFSPKAGLEAQA